MNYYFDALRRYADFDGRARRAEYWMFALFNFIVAFSIGFIEGLAGSTGIVGILYAVAVIIPSLAVGARRLHDTGRSGWWQLIGLIPLVGLVILIIFYAQDGQAGLNEYGPNPKGVDSASSRTTEQRLRELDILRQRGVITDDEYDDRRREIIAQM